jgi:hypothetical protein
MNIDGDQLVFLEAQQRPRKLAVVQCGRDDLVGRQLDETRRDLQPVIRLGLRRIVRRPQRARHSPQQQRRQRAPQERTAIGHHHDGRARDDGERLPGAVARSSAGQILIDHPPQ